MKSNVYFLKYEDNHNKLAQKLQDFLLKENQLLINKNDLVALKLHFGEQGNKGYIKPVFIKKIVDFVKKKKANPFLTDTNTLYKGKRGDSVHHLYLAYGHGFDFSQVEAPVIIADGMYGQNSDEVVVEGLKHFDTFKYASDIMRSDYILNLTHATGHMLTGYGGALKNIAMGCATRAGKMEQHAEVSPHVAQELCAQCGACKEVCPVDAIIKDGHGFHIVEEKCIGCGECIVACKKFAIEISWSEDTSKIQEKIVEYAHVFFKNKKHKIYNINFLMHFTKNCDCMARDEAVLVDDIGILISEDPLAIDKASIDLINSSVNEDIFKKMYPDIDINVTLNYASQLGVGNLSYDLVDI